MQRVNAVAERHQAWIYLASALLGLVAGSLVPTAAARLDVLVWPVLGLLLYATFVQTPLSRVTGAVRDRRFLVAVLAGNFVVLPALVWILLPLAGDDQAVRVGMLLVLLMPCTDWFLTFTHLAGGDTRKAIAVTPVLLLSQMALLPAYLWLFLGQGVDEIVAGGRVITVFVTLIVLPLLAAWVTQRVLETRGTTRTGARFARLPVLLLALVVFLLAASQVGLVLDSTGVLVRLVAAYILFLLGAGCVGLALGSVLRLDAGAKTATTFSLATRNSFVVLPFALALPVGFELAVVAVVVQSLVELFGMIVYLRVVPMLVGSSTTGS